MNETRLKYEQLLHCSQTALDMIHAIRGDAMTPQLRQEEQYHQDAVARYRLYLAVYRAGDAA